jgi:hypothetical protein
MISGSVEALDEALAILKALLQGEVVSKVANVILYEKYRYSTDVGEMLHYLADKLELKVYTGDDQLFLCPQVGSRLFGWSNEELRRGINYINNNSDLFTGYFIIMNLITMFYREAYPDTPVAYLKVNDLIEKVSRRLEALLKLDDLETVSQENQFDFADVGRVWQRLPDAREGISGGKNDKVAFVENICKFLQNERLVVFDQAQRIIYPTARLKTIIWSYYEDRDNRKDLLSLLGSMEVSG